jgi:hypothetical protein
MSTSNGFWFCCGVFSAISFATTHLDLQQINIVANEVLATKFLRLRLGSGCPPLEYSFLCRFLHFTLYQKAMLHKRLNAANSNYGIIPSQSHSLCSLITFHHSCKYSHVIGVSNLSNQILCEFLVILY